MTIDYVETFSDVADADWELARRTREFLATEILPRVGDLYEHGQFPAEIIPTLGALGLLGAPLAGFGNLSPLAWGLACRELERVDSGLRSFVSVQTCLVMETIERFGSPEQREEWLPALARGESVGCFALTEPGHGSDPAGIEVTASPVSGGGFRLSGHKRWSTNGTLARIAVVWAQTDSRLGSRGIRGFLVPLDLPGVEVRPVDRKLSLRVSASSEILFKDVQLPDAALLPGTTGLGSALSALNAARFSILWGVLGCAEACYEEALAHVTQREQFGRPLAGFQLVQEQLAEMVDRITTAQLLARRLAELKAAGRLRHQQVSLGKKHNVAGAQDVARRARALLGAEGILLDRHVLRHLSNLETVATYEGTEQIHLLSIGADVTGISAFR